MKNSRTLPEKPIVPDEADESVFWDSVFATMIHDENERGEQGK